MESRFARARRTTRRTAGSRSTMWTLLGLAGALALPASLTGQATITFQTHGVANRTVVTNRAQILDFHHELTVESSGVAARSSGQRRYAPIRIRKAVDKSTPYIYKALTGAETLASVELAFPSRSGGGMVGTYTITLTNAKITSVTATMSEAGEPVEDISFTFESIRWSHSDGGATHEDSRVTGTRGRPSG